MVGSAGSPTTILAISAASASTNSSDRLAGTRIRVRALQIWPLLDRLADRIPVATAAGSASARMMAADLPPSSRLTRLRSAPHACATRRPAAVEPVNDTLSTPGWATRCAPSSPSPGSTLTTPGGSPISSSMSASSSASSGDSGAGLSTTQQPASRAGTSLVAIRNWGMFHGTIAATTPTGSRRMWRSEPKKPGRISCHGWPSATSQKAPIIIRGSPTWARWANVMGAPSSVLIAWAISACRSDVELRQPTHGVDSFGCVESRPRAVVEGGTGRGNGGVDVGRPGRGDAGHDRLRVRGDHLDHPVGAWR